MTVDMRLVKKGRGEPREGLVQQGNVSVGLAKLHAAELADNGWPAKKTKDLEAGVAALESAAAVKTEAASLAKTSTKTEHQAIADAKTFIRRLRNALPTVLRENDVPGISAASFHAGTALGRSTPVISKYLNDIRASVEKLDKPLKAHFRGKLASSELDTAKSDLDGADAAQEVSLAGVPAETLKVYEEKGRVLELIEDLNRAAKNAFDGEAETAAKFNKDIVLRGRGKKTKSAGAADPPAGGTPPPIG